MKLYHHMQQAVLIRRLNRFVAEVLWHGQVETVHVKNTGRLGELLFPGASVWLEDARHPGRKTRFDLVAVEHDGYTVNIDSQAPNRVFREWAEAGRWTSGVSQLQSEVRWEDSRFDFGYMCNGTSALVEVKGVTLFDDAGMAYFPDAPTQRGIKHLHGLIRARSQGFDAGICFILQRDDVIGLKPNDATQPAFGEALRQARSHGVRVCALVCHTTPDSCTALREVPVNI